MVQRVNGGRARRRGPAGGGEKMLTEGEGDTPQQPSPSLHGRCTRTVFLRILAAHRQSADGVGYSCRNRILPWLPQAYYKVHDDLEAKLLEYMENNLRGQVRPNCPLVGGSVGVEPGLDSGRLA